MSSLSRDSESCRPNKVARQWDVAHAHSSATFNSAGTHLPSRLFTDENPATTMKGTGFKNAVVAQRTIELTSQPFAKYKQYWTIRAMRERAANHPHPTDGFQEAMKIFDEWLSKYEEVEADERRKQFDDWEEYKKLCNSNNANSHCHGNNPTKEQLQRARDDLSSGQQVLFNLIKKIRPGRKESPKAEFPITSFVAIFGGAGLHGYGSHDIKIEGMKSVSHVEIYGRAGLEELLVASKSSKLDLSGSPKIRVEFDRQKENAIITMDQTKRPNSLLKLWKESPLKSNTTDSALKRSTKDMIVSVKEQRTSECELHSANNEKRRKLDSSETFQNDHCDKSWSCSVCTFIHLGDNKIHYCVCEICGCVREWNR